MDNLETLKREFDSQWREFNTQLGEYQALQRQKEETQAEVMKLSELTTTLDKVTILLNSIGEDKQQQAQEQIEGIVTKGLQGIFGDTYSFHINQTMKGKNASVEFTIKSYLEDQVLETSILDSHGGGLASCVGFLLRCVILMLDPSKPERIIIGDETFGQLSESYIEPMAMFMRELVEKAGFQFVLVTHSPEWTEYADKTYRFGIKNGATHVKIDS